MVNNNISADNFTSPESQDIHPNQDENHIKNDIITSFTKDSGTEKEPLSQRQLSVIGSCKNHAEYLTSVIELKLEGMTKKIVKEAVENVLVQEWQITFSEFLGEVRFAITEVLKQGNHGANIFNRGEDEINYGEAALSFVEAYRK